MKRSLAIGSHLFVLVVGALALPTFAQATKPIDSANAIDRRLSVTTQTKIPWQLRDNAGEDTEQDRQERKRFEEIIVQQRLQVLAISTAIVNNSKDTLRLIERANRQTHFQDSIQAESLARNVVFPPVAPPAAIDSRVLLSLLTNPGMEQSTRIQLYRRIRDVVDQATEAYREYSTAFRRVYRSAGTLESIEKVFKEIAPEGGSDKDSEMNHLLEKAKLDLQALSVKRSQARQTIVDLAGEGVACGVEEQLKVAERAYLQEP